MATSTFSGRRWISGHNAPFWPVALLLLLMGLLLTPTHLLAAPTTASPTTTPTPGERARIPLADWGYDTRTLASPCGGTQYHLRLPTNWRVTEGSYLDLEYSYTYISPDTAETRRTYFGELMLYLDGQLLTTHSLDGANLERVHLPVPLPPEIFNADPDGRHDLDIALEASLLCNIPHRGTLTIHPESAFELHYRRIPLAVDLADYPRPFYQRTFHPDVVYFVLPEHPSEAEARAAAAIAARLGQLTSGMVISATTDAEVLGGLQAGQVISEHLIIIGTPASNRLTRRLAEQDYLPVGLRLAAPTLSLRGPEEVSPGGTYTYTIAVTNTTATPLSGLSVTASPPDYATTTECSPACSDDGSTVHWRPETLAGGATATFHLTVRFTATIPPSLTVAPESLVVLQAASGEPLNTVALASPLASAPALAEEVGERTATSADGDYLFTFADGRLVPPSDGLIQEIVSPWNDERAALLVTGSSETAILKAGLTLGLVDGVPEMAGAVAQVRAVRPPAPATTSSATEFTLSDLGYTDKTVYGAYSQDISYRFSIPLTWEPTEAASLHLLFGHAAALDGEASTLTILLNGTPLAGVPLDDSNAIGGVVDVPLPPSHIKRGLANELTIRVWMKNTASCERMDRQQIWLTVSGGSLLRIPHRKQEIQQPDLRYFPYPFDERPDLSTLLFILPPRPGRGDIGTLLTLAALLGDAAGDDGCAPALSLGGDLDEQTLSRYHLILIGRPSAHPFIEKFNRSLPQPFAPGSDLPEHGRDGVSLRLPEGINLGYLQEMVSPWNEKRVLLLVGGTTDEGVAEAAAALRRPWKLRGNLAVVRDDGEIHSIDTRGLTESGKAEAIATAVPELTPVPATPTATPSAVGTPQPTPTTASGPSRRRLPLWVKGVVGFTALVVLAVIGGVAHRSWRNRQRR